jgi:CHAT domain/Sulfatase-modifying factor enzyme 1
MFRHRGKPHSLSRSAEDFDLLIWKTPEGYRARVREPGSGREAHSDFVRPFSAEDLDGALGAREDCRDLRPSRPESGDLALKIGSALFEAIFVKEIFFSWHTRLSETERAGKDLRLRLHLDAPDLWDWPWEFLHDPRRGFLSTAPSTPVVRYVEMLERIHPLRVRPPIRVLAVAACPAGLSPLSVRDELAALESSLADLRHVELDRLEGATRDGLRRRLQEKTFHVIHLIGHGTFDASQGGGVVLLEREDGEADRLGARDLSVLLGAHRQLRLVILNICHGARGDNSDPFAGLTQGLIQGRLPAVIAMRSAVTDRAAVLFSRHFYDSLSRREPVDRAVSRARQAMFRQESAEWASPVLAMRSPDGRLFALFWWEILWSRLEQIVSARRRWLIALCVLILLVMTFRLGRRWVDPNPVFALLNPPECPSPPGLSIAFVKVTPDPPLRPFCIGRFEVTQHLWTKVMPKKSSSRRHGGGLPVVRVSWNGTTPFFASLDKREPSGRFRLPTGAEWEFAARAGEQSPSQASSWTANCKNREGNDGYEATAPVGLYLSNSLGLFDMLGNASEWVSDEDKATGNKIRRGGGFNNALKNCSVAYISSVQPDFRYDDAGFRIVRDPVK